MFDLKMKILERIETPFATSLIILHVSYFGRRNKHFRQGFKFLLVLHCSRMPVPNAGRYKGAGLRGRGRYTRMLGKPYLGYLASGEPMASFVCGILCSVAACFSQRHLRKTSGDPLLQFDKPESHNSLIIGLHL